MPGTRNRSPWIWVAIAAVAFTSVARAEAGLQSAKAYAHPVLAFLAKTQSQHPAAKTGVSRFAQRASGRQIKLMSRDAGPGAWMAMLPVFFIGLVSPLTLVSAASLCDICRAPASPSLPAAFQRPPPSLA